MFSRRNLLSGLAASVAPASAIARTTEPPALAEDEPTKESRRAVRESLAREIELFIEFASPEDAWLMGEILTVWGSNNQPLGAEVYLATAFQCVLHRSEGYMKVPDAVVTEIDWFIRTLQRAQGGLREIECTVSERHEQSRLIGKYAALVYSADGQRLGAIKDALAQWEGESPEGGAS